MGWGYWTPGKEDPRRRTLHLDHHHHPSSEWGKWKKIRGYQLRAAVQKRSKCPEGREKKMMDDPLRHREGICNDEHGVRRKLKLSPVPLPLNPSVSRVTSFPSPSRPPQKVSGTSAEAHDPERIVDWPCHSLREEEQDRRRSWLFRVIKTRGPSLLQLCL